MESKTKVALSTTEVSYHFKDTGKKKELTCSDDRYTYSKPFLPTKEAQASKCNLQLLHNQNMKVQYMNKRKHATFQ